MQEDFPCQIGQGSYEMHIEPDEQRLLAKEEQATAYLTMPLPSLKEVEMPRDQLAMIQLDNNIKLCLSVKHTYQEDMNLQDYLESISKLREQQAQGGVAVDSESMRFSVKSNIQYENDKITSVVVIQIQNQTLNIINDMFLINQLQNSMSSSLEGQGNEVQLTKQNLQCLPDDSGKRNQNKKPHQIRKGSDNSNDSDTTQPLIQNQSEQQKCNPSVFNCHQCGAQNQISSSISQENQKGNSNTLPIIQEQIELPSQNSNKNSSSCNEKILDKIKNQNYQQDIAESAKRVSAVSRRARKGAMEEELTESVQQNGYDSKVVNSCSKSSQVELSLNELNNSTSTPSYSKRYRKSKLIQNEVPLVIQEPLKNDINQIVNVNPISEQNYVNQNKSQREAQSFQMNQNLISTTQQVQTESYYNSSTNINNQSDSLALKSSCNENLILPNIQIIQDRQSCKDLKSTQSIPISEKNTENIHSNKNPKKTTNIPTFNHSKSNIENGIKDIPNILVDIGNYENIQSFSCTSLLSSPTARRQIPGSYQNIQINYEPNQTHTSISNIHLENDQSKEQDMSIQQSQDSSGEKQDDNQSSFCYGENFTDEFIAKADKKNVVKNFVKAFISFVKKDEEILNSLECKDSKNQSFGQKVKKFQNYMKKYKFNNLFIKQLISNSEYSSIFQEFLLRNADDWLINSNVQDKETHKQMLKFFQKAIDNEDLLNKLKTLKKNKRVPNSSSIKVNSSFTPKLGSTRVSMSSMGIGPFSTSPEKDIDFVQIIDDNFNQLAALSSNGQIEEIQSSSMFSQQQLDEQRNQNQNLNCIQTIQRVFNEIQINNPSFLMTQINNNQS